MSNYFDNLLLKSSDYSATVADVLQGHFTFMRDILGDGTVLVLFICQY